jgi:hypothetical protein
MDQKRERRIWAAEIGRVIFFFDSSSLLFASRVQLEVI